MYRVFLLVLVSLGMLLCTSQGAIAQTYRTRLIPQAHKIYKHMLSQAKDGKGKAIRRSLQFLRQLLGKMTKRFRLDMKRKILSALKQKNYVKVHSLLIQLIAMDMRDILYHMRKSKDKPKLKGMFRMLHADYKLLYLYHFKRNSRNKQHQLLMRQIRRIYRQLFSRNPYDEDDSFNVRGLGRRLKRMDRGLSKVFLLPTKMATFVVPALEDDDGTCSRG